MCIPRDPVSSISGPVLPTNKARLLQVIGLEDQRVKTVGRRRARTRLPPPLVERGFPLKESPDCWPGRHIVSLVPMPTMRQGQRDSAWAASPHASGVAHDASSAAPSGAAGCSSNSSLLLLRDSCLRTSCQTFTAKKGRVLSETL